MAEDPVEEKQLVIADCLGHAKRLPYAKPIERT
jgi:hypothetical protein